MAIEKSSHVRLHHALHQELKATGNVAGYLQQAALQRVLEINAAEEALTHWSKPEVEAAIEAIGRPPSSIVKLGTETMTEELEDAWTDGEIPEEWGIGADQWSELVQDVRETDAVALALRVLVRERHTDPSFDV